MVKNSSVGTRYFGDGRVEIYYFEKKTAFGVVVATKDSE